MKLNIQRISKDIELPSYSQQGDAGIDLRSAEDITLKPNELRTIKSGIKIEIPPNHVGLIWDRSGLAAKNGLTCLAGVIDSNFRGEIGIVLKNLGNESIQIEKNMRIAQLLIQPIISANIEEVSQVDETKRNHDGFGSSGLK
jgi:dUTP pyrophosphatase